jgi:hypothetical protein
MAAQLQELTFTGPAEPCDDMEWEPNCVLRNPDWYRDGDNPQVQIISISISYNGRPPKTVSSDFLPDEVLQKKASDIARDLLYDALYEVEER